MKRQLLIALVLASFCTSCVQPNGYIGDLFGMWQLVEMWNGDEVEQRDDIFYSFQSSVIDVRLVRRESNLSIEFYGDYICEDDSIFFPILVGADWGVPPELRLELIQGEEYVNKFKVETLTNSQMVWTRGDDERFVFRKY